jgi:hypothetical protein
MEMVRGRGSKGKIMYPECRHVQPSGKKCSATALKGTVFCYFHTRLHTMNKKPPKPMEFIEIPALEDRASIQLTITQVLRAFAAGCLDQNRTNTLLYGLQLATQNVDRTSWAIPIGTIKSLHKTKEGEELAPEQMHLELDDYEDDDDDDDDDE